MSYFTGKSILVTGGTGSIGRAIVARLLTRHEPDSVLVLSRDVTRQLNMQEELRFDNLHFMMGNVEDSDTMMEAADCIDLVIHAAACKHVPACEESPRDAININIMGSLNVLRAAWQNGVDTCLAISTDKACEPTGVMGMTKALMERLFVQYKWAMRTLCVRSGNVAGSHGSVIPLWRKQIAAGGSVTMTDPLMIRYFITIEKLVDAIFLAIELGKPGDIFVPKMNRVQLEDLVEVMTEGTGVQIKEIGARLGEKCTEEIISEIELTRTTDEVDFYRISATKTGGIPCVNRNFMTKSEIRTMLEQA